MGLEQGNETGGEVQQNAGQASPTGVAPSQTPQNVPSQQQSAPAQPWKVRIGDTEYDEATWRSKGVEDFRKFHGEYTRTRQEFSKLRDESTAGLELLQMVKGDPQLLAEVRKRMASGQTQEQAVQGAVQNDPRIDQLSKKMDAMEQEKATSSFRSKHPDMTDEDTQWIVKWLGDNTDRLQKAGWDYEQILDVAWSQYFTNEKSKAQKAELISQGQKMTEDAITKGRKSTLLGAPAPTAQSSKKQVKSTLHLNPAQRQDLAMEKFLANKKRG